MAAYFGLFVVSFLAATLLPGGSEIALTTALASTDKSVTLLIAFATIGNVLGSLVNWVLGRYFNHLQDRTWYPIKPDQMVRAEQWYRKYGRWSLLLSWAPIIGDPLTMISGVFREPLLSFVILVTIAKLTRYLVVSALVLQII
ncbi:MAG: DedA family protein [Rhizobiaceae bacterium]|nr:DedA family protein [Rhizobiaceae bacterium]